MSSSEENTTPKSKHSRYLIQIYGQNINKRFKLHGHAMRLGRLPRSHIRIDCPNVSRNHCTLQLTPNGWTIKDNNSRNGTYINGRRLMKHRRIYLFTGDVICLGPPSDLIQAFCYDDYSAGRERVMSNLSKYGTNLIETLKKLKPGTTLSLIASEANEYGQTVKPSEVAFDVKNTPEDSHTMNLPPSTSVSSYNVSYTYKQTQTSEQNLRKRCRKRTRTPEVMNPNKKFSASNSAPKLPSNNKFFKPCEEESKSAIIKTVNAVADFKSFVDWKVSSQDPEQSAGVISEDKSAQEKVETGASHEVQSSLHLQEAFSQLLKSKFALFEEIKNLEKSKADLLKDYAKVCEKNKLLDQQLAEEKKLKEDLQMCEMRVRSNFIDQIMEKLEEELICTICTEVFIKPTVLDCSHTFCEHCIAEWLMQKRQCPICRHGIKNQTRILALDHFIDKTLETLTPEQKESRNKLVKEREQIKASATSLRCSRERELNSLFPRLIPPFQGLIPAIRGFIPTNNLIWPIPPNQLIPPSQNLVLPSREPIPPRRELFPPSREQISPSQERMPLFLEEVLDYVEPSVYVPPLPRSPIESDSEVDIETIDIAMNLSLSTLF